MDNVKIIVISTYDLINGEREYDEGELKYDENYKYRTNVYVNNRNTFKGFVSGKDLREGNASLDSEYYEDWLNAVNEHIGDVKDRIAKKEREIKFVILGVDSRYAYDYEMYTGKTLTKKGTGWGKEFRRKQDEKEAWIKAVVQYRKDNGIEAPTEVIEKKIERAKEIVDQIDECLPKNLMETIPNITEALAKLTSDPCNAVKELVSAVKTSIGKINGLPNPKEIKDILKDILLTNKGIDIEAQAREKKSTVKDDTYEVCQGMHDSLDYYKRLDAEREEWLKTHSDEVAVFETAEYQQVKLPEYVNAEDEDEDEDDYNDYGSGGVMDEEVQQYLESINISTKDDGMINIWFDKVLEPNKWRPEKGMTKDMSRVCKVFGDGKTSKTIYLKKGMKYMNDPKWEEWKKIDPDVYNSRHIIEFNVKWAVKDCFVPLIKAWNAYCRKNNQKEGVENSCGYRNPYYNATLGMSSETSAHMSGLAMDCAPINGNVKGLADFWYKMCKDPNCPIKFDQILREYYTDSAGKVHTWVHIGFAKMNICNNILPSGNKYYQRGQYFPDYAAKAPAGQHGQCITIMKTREIKYNVVQR